MSGYQNNQNQTPFKVTPFVEHRLAIVGDRLPDARKDPYLSIQVRKNEVIMTSHTGLFGADSKQVTLQVKLDAYTFGVVVNYASEIGGKEAGFKFPLIRCFSPRKRNPGETGTPKVLAAVIQVGKDQQGCCYISLLRKDPPHIKYIFRPTVWNELIDATTQQPAELSVVSALYSKAWSTLLAPLVVSVLSTDIHDWRAEKEAQGGGNNGGNNGNYNNGNQGNGNQSSAPATTDSSGWDADIPM